jgi:hypothetical protein
MGDIITLPPKGKFAGISWLENGLDQQKDIVSNNRIGWVLGHENLSGNSSNRVQFQNTLESQKSVSAEHRYPSWLF